MKEEDFKLVSMQRVLDYIVPLQVDTWAAGVTIYQIAVGHLPFQGSNTMDMEATRTAILKGRVYYPGGTPPLLQAFLEVQTSLKFLPSVLDRHRTHLPLADCCTSCLYSKV